MSMIGIDAEETAQALDSHAEFAAAELMRDLDSRLTQAQAEVGRLRQVIAHLMTNPLNQREATYWTSDIDGQTGTVEIVAEPGDRTTIRITE
ncbi:hypothetical protein [Streptomyces lacrimifluminis]|uniref:hypothetical protein n=1 Tax=Streptomyces lacrimifluminis TaxID=1500077 RepID=UPI0031F14F62